VELDISGSNLFKELFVVASKAVLAVNDCEPWNLTKQDDIIPAK